MSKWTPGMPSPNKSGRPKGIVDKRMRLQKALMGDADALLAVAKSKAFEGDPQMLNLLLSRVMPTLKAEGERVEFVIDTKATPAQQIESVVVAVAAGQLTLEQGRQMVEMIGRLAEVRALEGGDNKAQNLVNAFKEFAQGIEARTIAPYTPPGSTNPSGGSTPPPAPPPT